MELDAGKEYVLLQIVLDPVINDKETTIDTSKHRRLQPPSNVIGARRSPSFIAAITLT